MGVAASGLNVEDFQKRCRRFQAFGGVSRSGNVDPVVGAFGAGLHHFEPEGPSFGRGGSAHDKLVVIRCGQCVFCAFGCPSDFKNTLGVFLPMAFIRCGQGADFGAHRPAGFGHGLGRVKASGNGDAQGGGGLGVAAVADPKGGAVAGVGSGCAVLQYHVGESRCWAGNEDECGNEAKGAKFVHGENL